MIWVQALETVGILGLTSWALWCYCWAVQLEDDNRRLRRWLQDERSLSDWCYQRMASLNREIAALKGPPEDVPAGELRRDP